MGSFFRLENKLHECKSLHLLIFLFWIFGLLAGTCVGYFSVDFAEQLIRSVVHSDNFSVLVVLTIRILPVFITMIAVYCSRAAVLLPIIFLKSFFLSYVCTLIALISTFASWLFCLLLMFDEILALPVLFYFWLCAFSNSKKSLLSQRL